MLSEVIIQSVVNRIVEVCYPEKVILFGSYAYGNPSEDSDLDLLIVIKSSDKSRRQRNGEVRKHLWGMLSVPKDILVYTEAEIDAWKNVELAFITSVVKSGRVLYEKG